MKKIIFAIPSNGSEEEVPILVESIRKFGGQFSDSKIWVLIPETDNKISDHWKTRVESQKAEIITFLANPQELALPFGRFVIEAAKAETMARGKTEFLVWLDDNCLIIDEPKEFLLNENQSLGYRPVHHTLIGSVFDEPLDAFWKRMYEHCQVKEETVFPMKTHVDGKILRPYINSGFLVVRPEKNFFKEWATKYFEIYSDYQEYYEKSELYSIFTHQAVLSSMLLTKFKRSELKELPFEYNYPIHLYPESVEESKPKSISDMITLRYYMKKLQDPEWMKLIPIDEPLKTWLGDKVAKK